MIEQDIHMITLLLGAFAFAYNVINARFYLRDREGIGGRMAWMMIAEAVAVLSVLVYTVSSYIGIRDIIPSEYSMIMRPLIILVLLHSSIRLNNYVRELLSENSDSRRQAKNQSDVDTCICRDRCRGSDDGI